MSSPTATKTNNQSPGKSKFADLKIYASFTDPYPNEDSHDFFVKSSQNPFSFFVDS